jgi:tetratricopeptide (TPR) repeat protein
LREDQNDYFTNLGVTVLESKSPGSRKRAQRILRQAMFRNPASRPAFELARILDDVLANDVEQAVRNVRWALRYSRGLHTLRLRKRLRNLRLSFRYHKPPAEKMYMRAIFASTTIQERTQIRVCLAASLLNWKSKSLKIGFRTEDYRSKICESISKLMDSPSLVGEEEWKILTNALELARSAPAVSLVDYLPDTFYIRAYSRSSDIVLFTTLYKESQIGSILNLTPTNTSDNNQKVQIRKQIRAVKACLRNYTSLHYEVTNRKRNPLVWIRGVAVFALGGYYNNRFIMETSKVKKKRSLRQSITCLRKVVNIFDDEAAFPREQILISTYGMLSKSEYLMAQVNEELNEYADGLSESLTSAKKYNSRQPFDAIGYMESRNIYLSRGDFDSAAKFSEIARSLRPVDPNFILSSAQIHWNIGIQMVNEEKKRKYFETVVELFDKYLMHNIGTGDIHFWLGRCLGYLRNYDMAIGNLNIAKNMNYYIIETCLDIVKLYLEQERFDLADRELDEIIHNFAVRLRFIYRIERRKNRRRKNKDRMTLSVVLRIFDAKWETDNDNATPAWFLLQKTLLLKAFVQSERSDFRDAQRHLDRARRFAEHSPRQQESTRHTLIEQTQLRRALKAQSLEVQGQIHLGQGSIDRSLPMFEESLKAWGNERTAFQLATLAVCEAEDSTVDGLRTRIDQADRKIGNARQLDKRGLYEMKLAALVRRLEKVSGSAPGKAA